MNKSNDSDTKTGKMKRDARKFQALAAEKLLDTSVGGKSGDTVAIFSNAEMIAAMRKAYFADVDAMEDVEIPK